MPLVSSDPNFNNSNPALNSAGSLTGVGAGLSSPGGGGWGGQGGTQKDDSGGPTTGGGISGGGERAEASGGISSSSAGANRSEQQHDQQSQRDASSDREHGGGGDRQASTTGGFAGRIGAIAAYGAGLGFGADARMKDQSRLDTGRPDSSRAFGFDMVGTGSRGIVDPLGTMHPVSSLDSLGIRDVNFSDPKMNAWKDIIGQGKTPAQAAGIVGSLFGESAFNPLAGDYATGTHLGYGQWGGSRLTNLEDFAGTEFTGPRGPGIEALSGPSPQAQTDFIREEMMGTKYPDFGARKLQSRMEANPDMTAEEAAQLHTSLYERPSKKEYAKSIDKRVAVANDIMAGFGTAPGYGTSSAAAFVDPMSAGGPARRSPINPPVSAPAPDPFADYQSNLTNEQYLGQFPTHNVMSVFGGNLTPARYTDAQAQTFANPIGGGLTAASEIPEPVQTGGQYRSALGALAPAETPQTKAIKDQLMGALNDRGPKTEKKATAPAAPKPASTVTTAPGPTPNTLEQNMQLVYGASGDPGDWYAIQRAKLEQELAALGVKI